MVNLTRRAFGLLASGPIAAVTGAAVAGTPVPARADATAPLNVVVFAEPTIEPVLRDVVREWPGRASAQVVFFGTRSDVMIEQRVRGARCDILIATRETMDAIAVPHKLVLAGTRVDLWRNRLVLATRAPAPAGMPVTLSSATDLLGMLKAGRLAMADAAVSTAGVDAQAALETLGLWAGLQGHIQGAESSPGAAFLVAEGVAPYGLLYGTDVAADPRLAAIATVPDDAYPPVVYALALMDGVATDAPRRLGAYLRSPEVAALLKAKGLDSV